MTEAGKATSKKDPRNRQNPQDGNPNTTSNQPKKPINIGLRIRHHRGHEAPSLKVCFTYFFHLGE
jgi:hypothetical protein